MTRYCVSGLDNSYYQSTVTPLSHARPATPRQLTLDLVLICTRFTHHSFPYPLFFMPAPVPSSPDVDVFATPPTTPMTSEPSSESIIRPSISRLASRPSNLQLSQTAPAFKPDILLESQSPQTTSLNKSSPQVMTPQSVNGSVVDGHATTNGHSNQQLNDSGHDSLSETPMITTTATDGTRPSQTSPDSIAPTLTRSHAHTQSPIMSPCFVHSNLDKGASFSEWLKSSNPFAPRIDVAPALQSMSADVPKAPPHRCRKLDNGQVIPIPYEDDKVETVFDASDYEDDDGSSSLTKQLAETAVGVREMSKQLGTFGDPRSLLLPAHTPLNGTQAVHASGPIFRAC